MGIFAVSAGLRSEIADDVVLLRPYREDDAAALFEAVRESLAELVAWMPWAHEDYALEEAEAWLASRDEAWGNEEFSFAICDRSTGRFLGGTGLNQLALEERRASLGYWVRQTACGRGIATRAAYILARAAFEDLRLERIEIIAAVTNVASQRVAAKLGAVREGTLRNRIRSHEQQRDAYSYSLVPGDLCEPGS